MVPVLLLIGLITGIVVGLFGIGGGVLLFPVMLYYNFTVPQIVAVSLFLNAIPNTLPGLYLYYKQGHFDLRVGLTIALGVLVGSVIGSYLGAYGYFSEKFLHRVYTLILCVIVVYMVYTHF